MSSGFDSFNFAGNEDWQKVESNLYFSSSSQAENDRILLKRKRKWYKANIDSSYEWVEDQSSGFNQTYGNKQEEQPKPKPESPRSSSYVPPATGPAGASSAAPKSKLLVYVSWVQLALHALQILSVLCYILPLAGVEQQSPSFFRCMLLNIAAQAVYLVRQHGRPRWNAEYGRSLFQDEQAHFFFASVVLINATPSIMLLLPFFSRSLVFVCGGLKQILPKSAPRIYALIAGPIEKVVGLYAKIYETNALLEVLSGFMLVFQLLTPSRNLMLILGWWQYLRIRYMLSNDSKRAFGLVKARIDGWIAHPMCPAILRTLYAKAVAAMEAATDQAAMAQQAQAGGGGIMSKCAIM